MPYSILSIPEILHKRRSALQETQGQIAQRAGTPQSNISAIEQGKVDPRLSTVQDLARALGMELVLVPIEAIPAVEALIGQGLDPADRPLFSAAPD